MALHDKLIAGLNRAVELAGVPVRIRYFSVTPGSVWDDEVALTQSGTSLWTSGVVFSLNTRQGSSDSVLLQQGKLINSDKKIYTNGSLLFTGSSHMIDIQIGSPTGDLYTTIEDGGNVKEVQGLPVYKKQFIRRLTGSLING